MNDKQRKAFLCPLIFGIVLIIIGCSIKLPGTALTTYGSLDGETCDSEYYLGDRYSAVDEYVGGDAYNYIIGASLVAGKISGTITAKAVCIVAGILCVCVGCTMWMLVPEKNKEIQKICSALPEKSDVDNGDTLETEQQ